MAGRKDSGAVTKENKLDLQKLNGQPPISQQFNSKAHTQKN